MKEYRRELERESLKFVYKCLSCACMWDSSIATRIKDVNNIINQLDLTDIYKILQPKPKL